LGSRPIEAPLSNSLKGALFCWDGLGRAVSAYAILVTSPQENPIAPRLFGYGERAYAQ